MASDQLERLTLQWDDAYNALLAFKQWCHGRYEKIQQGEVPTYKEKRDCVERMGIRVVVNLVEGTPGYPPEGFIVTSDPPEIVEHLGKPLRHTGADRCLCDKITR
jgi:hypothetical protein